jgi:tRNA threonylcarbamoyladenosine biosynthesis protein TsaE
MSKAAFTVISESPEQTRALGRLLGALVHDPLLIWLAGDLGAGKTCLTQGLATGLGVPPNEPVTSPSYTLMNRYEGRLPLYHFDLYRLNHPDDLEDLDFSTYAEGDGVTVVEWADRFDHPYSHGLLIRVVGMDDQRRSIEFHPSDVGQTTLLETLLAQWAKEVQL